MRRKIVYYADKREKDKKAIPLIEKLEMDIFKEIGEILI